VHRTDIVEDLALEPVIGCLTAALGWVLLDLVDPSANVGTKLVIRGLRVVGSPNVEPDSPGQLLLRPFGARRWT
jgi:hypothetical protein